MSDLDNTSELVCVDNLDNTNELVCIGNLNKMSDLEQIKDYINEYLNKIGYTLIEDTDIKYGMTISNLKYMYKISNGYIYESQLFGKDREKFDDVIIKYEVHTLNNKEKNMKVERKLIKTEMKNNKDMSLLLAKLNFGVEIYLVKNKFKKNDTEAIQIIVMEKYKLSLHDYFNSNIYNNEDCKTILNNIFKIYKSMVFDEGIYYTDIKPCNIVLNNPEDVKFIDCGSMYCTDKLPPDYEELKKELDDDRLDLLFYGLSLFQFLFIILMYSCDKENQKHIYTIFFDNKLFRCFIENLKDRDTFTKFLEKITSTEDSSKHGFIIGYYIKHFYKENSCRSVVDHIFNLKDEYDRERTYCRNNIIDIKNYTNEITC